MFEKVCAKFRTWKEARADRAETQALVESLFTEGRAIAMRDRPAVEALVLARVCFSLFGMTLTHFAVIYVDNVGISAVNLLGSPDRHLTTWKAAPYPVMRLN